MSKLVGGNVRFRGPGRSWKSSWRGRTIFSELCCVHGFENIVFYQNASGPLDIVPASGFFLGALVGVAEPPAGVAVIARNGDPLNGWQLDMIDNSGAWGAGVSFRYTVYDGANIAAQVVTPLVSLANVGGIGPPKLFVDVMVAFYQPALFPPDGMIAIAIGGALMGSEALAAPYANANPQLLVGRDVDELGADTFDSPNCISGLVGGTAPWTDQTLAAVSGQWRDALTAGGDTTAAPGQMVEVPTTSVPGMVNTNGWRIPGGSVPGAAAPSPLAGFIGAEALEYGYVPVEIIGDPPTLTLESVSPVLFWPDNTEFPYGPS
jgi:hypothetical protein